MRFLSRLISRLPTFAKKTFVSFFLRFGSLGLQFAGSVLIARALGAAGFGAYGYAFTWAVLIGTVLGLGMGQLAIREVPRYLARHEHAALRGFIMTWALGLVGSGLLAAAVLAGLDTVGWLDFAVSWPLVALAAVAHAVVLGLSALLSGFQRILQAQFLEGILRQVLFLGALLALVFWGLSVDTTQVFQLSLLTALPVVALMVWLLARSLTAAMPTPAPARAYTVLPWLAGSLPLLLTTLSTQLQTSLDTLVLGAMVDDASLGVYRAAARGADLIQIAHGLTLQVLGPMLARALAQDDRTAAQSMISQSAVMSSLLGLSICAALAMFPGTYLGLFGDEFRTATPVLWILVATQAIAILCGPVGLILVMLRRERLVLFTTVAALALNFGLKLVLIPLWGTLGAAVATLIAISVVKVVLLVAVVRGGGLDPTLWLPLKRRLAALFRRG